MTTVFEELKQKIEDYDESIYSNDSIDLDDDAAYASSIFSSLYYGEFFSNGEYIEFPEKPFTFEWPKIGTIKVIDTYEDHDDGHGLFLVFEYKDTLFQYCGWSDSWSDDGGFDGPLELVEEEQVVKTVYKVVKQ